MNAGGPPPLPDPSDEISALIATLHRTDARLDELTGGEVDGVTNARGGTFLLQRAQELQRHNEADKQAAVLNALPANIAMLDTRGVIVSVNQAWRSAGPHALQGPGHAIGLNYFEICGSGWGNDATEGKRIAEGIRSILKGLAASFSTEYSTQFQSEQRSFLLTVAPLAKDRPSGAVVMIQDITARVRAQEAQRATSQLLDNIVENIPTAVQLKSVNDGMRIQMWNKAAEAMYGLPSEAAIGRTVHDLWPVPDADLMHASDLELVKTNTVQDFPDRLAKTKNRGDIRVHMRKVALLDANGAATHVLVVADDMTAKLADEARLRDSEARFRSLTKLSSDWFWEQDAEHRFVRFSGGDNVEGWGPDQDKAVGLHRWDLGGVVPISSGWEEHRALMDARKPFRNFEYQRILDDGRLQYVAASGEPIFDAGGRFTGYRGVATEITERKKAELRIRRLNRVYAVLSGINTLIVRVRDRDELFREACRIAIEAGAFKMAWIGVIDQKTLDGKVVAWHGGEESYLDMIRLTAREGTPHSDRPGSRAMRLMRPVICNDIATDPAVRPLRDELLRRGHKSTACFPLSMEGRPEGVLCLFSGEVNVFDDEETRLLVELANDISMALEHIDKAQKLERMTRVNAMLSAINGAIVRIRDRQELSEEACRISVEIGGLTFAWLGVVNASETELEVVASAGRDDGFLQTIRDRLAVRGDASESRSLSWSAVRERRAVAVNDISTDTVLRSRTAFADRGIKSVAVFPFLVAGRIDGTFALHSEQAGFFDDDEMRLLNEVAANISFALEHIEKEEKVRRLTRVYAVLSGINALIVRARDRTGLFKEACEIAVDQGQFKTSWIGVIGPGAMGIEPVASAGARPGYLAFVKDRFWLAGEPSLLTMTARAVLEKKALFSNDTHNDPGIKYKNEHVENGTRSLASIPLVIADEAVGVLCLYTEEADFFDAEEMNLLVEMAGNIAFAVDNIDKARKLDRTTRVNAVLSGINGAIVRVRDRQALLDEACRIAVETGGLPFASLSTVDEAGMQLRPVASAGVDDGFLAMFRSRFSLRDDAPEGHGISARSVRQKRVMVANDVMTDANVMNRTAYADRGIKSIASLPLMIAGRAVGAFTLHAAEPDFFDDNEIRLLNEVVANIAFALEHIEKEVKVRRLTRVYAVLSGINTLIVRTRERDELFREACRIAVEAGQFAKAWIGIVDPATKKFTMVAAHGGDPLFFRSLEKELAAKVHEGRGLMMRAIETGQPVIVNDTASDLEVLLKDDATAAGVRSLAMLPLSVSGEVVAVFALNADVVGFFDDQEMKLLVELAGDIGFALDHIGKEAKLNYLAYYDALTGLANRTLFLERVAQYKRSAVAGGHKFALFILDLERFRNINDSLGRPAGDSLLKQVAAWLTRNVRDASLLAHLGSDQFAIVLPELRQDGDVARLLDKRIQAFHEHTFRVDETEFRITLRAGVALFPDDGTDVATLLRNAEAALKNAKARGDRFLFYNLKMTEAVAGKLTLENQLRRALDNEEFVLHYQPKVSLESGKLTSAEALIRWNDPQTGLVPPGKFIPVLEETGLIYDVGRWALRKAVSEYLRWRAAGLPAVRIAVNVSPLQLRNRGFVAEIRGVVGIDPEASAGLEIEITESVIMEDVKSSIASLQAIRAMGVTIAIDDFGTGFSSLSHLARLPVDTLKIDRSFVINMTSDAQGLSLVSTIINLAHSLKLKVVAEGVETEEQSRLLRLLRCNEMQGFLFSRPVPAEVFEAKFLALPVKADAA